MITAVEQPRLPQKISFRIISDFLDLFSMLIHTGIKNLRI